MNGREKLRMRLRMYIACMCLVLSGLWLTPVNAAARCFVETGYCIDGAIHAYWEAHGGLMVFGLPIGALSQTTVDGVQVSTQLFERNRIELHPNNRAPYDVEIGLLGSDYLFNTTGARTTPAGAINEVDSAGIAKSARKDCQWFAATRQYVCGEFYSYWRQYGISSHQRGPFSIAENMALFGLPITGVYQQTINGHVYQVQVFERARFEYHPENPAPYKVQLGLLGREMLTQSQPQPTSTVQSPVISATSTPFVVADYLGTTGILPESDLRYYRTSLPRVGYWNSNAAADIFVILQDVTYEDVIYDDLRIGHKAPKNTKYMVGMVTVVNNRPLGSAACRVSVYDFSIIDLEGSWHTSDDVTKLVQTPLSYKMLEPGRRYFGRIVFPVPYNSAPGQLVAQFTYEQPVTVELRVWPHVN